MLGAIVGDIIGSRFEHANYKGKDFQLCHPNCRFTDDTILTVAIADALIHGQKYAQLLKQYYQRYPEAGYGANFHLWAQSNNLDPYGSFGNGAAMRVSPVAWFYDDMEEILREAELSAAVTHNHSEGIKGAQATAAAIFLARTTKNKNRVRDFVENHFHYDLDRTPDEIRPGYSFDVSCQGSVPEAICCILHSVDFEDAVRTAVSIGGDSDTIACITGSIAEALYGVPDFLQRWGRIVLDEKLLGICDRFWAKVGDGWSN